MRQFDAGLVEAEEAPADVADDDQDVGQDAGDVDVDARQGDVEQGQAGKTDDGQAFAEDGHLAQPAGGRRHVVVGEQDDRPADRRTGRQRKRHWC